MSFRSTELRRSGLAILVLSLITARVVLAQAAAPATPPPPIAFADPDAITTTFVNAPNLSGSGGGGDNNQWLKVEIHYGTVAGLKVNYLDSVQLKIWIEARDLLAPNTNAPGQGVSLALTGSVTYINIPVGRDIYGVFYVHPSTLGRYSTERGYTDFDRKFNIHVEAYMGGILMIAADKQKDPDGPTWYQKLRATPGLVYRQDQCAFLVVDTDRYPAIKLPADSSSP
jgi:hypothetical protein